jgi:type VI secretion system secreted protein VgrG
LFITTEGKPGEQKQSVKDATKATERLTAAHRQHTDMAKLAQQAEAQQETFSQDDATQGINAHHKAVQGGKPTQDNPFPEFTEPNLAFSSAAGIISTATDSTHMASGNDHVVTASRDVSVSAGRSLLATARNAISLFAYRLGIRMIAAMGKVVIQAQKDEALLAALKDLTVSSSEGRVVITAGKEVWVGANGSYLCLNNGGITLGTPGQILNKSASWEKDGPDSQKVMLAMPTVGDTQNFIEVQHHYDDLESVKGAPYKLHFSDGSTVAGKLDAQGFMHLDGVPPGQATLELGEDIRQWQAKAKLANRSFNAASDAQSGMDLVKGILK